MNNNPYTNSLVCGVLIVFALSGQARGQVVFDAVDIQVAQPAAVLEFVEEAPVEEASDQPDGDKLTPAAQQAMTMLRPFLEVELSFANRTCKFTDEQRAQVIDQGKQLLRTLAIDFSKNDRGNRNVIVHQLGGALFQRARSDDFSDKIEQAVKELVIGLVQEDQQETYLSELSRRKEFQQQVIVNVLVLKLDEALYLSDEQQQAIHASLLKGWDSNWAPNLGALENYSNYMPQIPDKLLTPHLDGEQKKIWTGVQKISIQNHFAGMNNEFQVIDDIKLDE